MIETILSILTIKKVLELFVAKVNFKDLVVNGTSLQTKRHHIEQVEDREAFS